MAGSIQIEIQDADGKPIPGFTLADCPSLFGNSVDYPVRFNGKADLGSLAGKPVRLRFVLKDADLYAFFPVQLRNGRPATTERGPPNQSVWRATLRRDRRIARPILPSQESGDESPHSKNTKEPPCHSQNLSLLPSLRAAGGGDDRSVGRPGGAAGGDQGTNGPTDGLVAGRQVRHVHPLGPLCRSRPASGTATRSPGLGEWIQSSGKIPEPDYAKLQHQFNPVKYDAKKWVALAKRAGVKYIVITSKHHDGFCLFDSKLTDYDVMGTPYGRDLLKPLADECHRQGIKICFYHSILDWHQPDAKGKDFPKYVEHLRGQLRELLTNYGPIGVLWFDGEWIPEWTEEQGRDLEKYLRSIQPDLIVNNRVGKRKQTPGDFGTPEQEIPATGTPGGTGKRA